MKYLDVSGGHLMNNLNQELKWYRSIEDKAFCKECLEIFPSVEQLDIYLKGKYRTFPVGQLGGITQGIIHCEILEQIGSSLFHQVFSVSNVFINGELTDSYKAYFPKGGSAYCLRGDHTSINEACKCNRRKYYPKVKTGLPYMLKATIPETGICHSNLNHLILREDILARIKWGSLPRPYIRTLATRDAPIDCDPAIF